MNDFFFLLAISDEFRKYHQNYSIELKKYLESLLNNEFSEKKNIKTDFDYA